MNEDDPEGMNDSSLPDPIALREQLLARAKQLSERVAERMKELTGDTQIDISLSSDQTVEQPLPPTSE